MPITFNCPHCKAKMTVPDQMAGKRGKCSKCKGAIEVPAANGAATPPPTPAPAPAQAAKKKVAAAAPAPEPPPPPPPEAPEDLESAALSVLADEPKKTDEPTESDFIAFICPQCDENVKLPIAEAGKRAQCPSCRRIIQVPRPAKRDEKNWRDTGPSLPSGAKRDVGPEPTDAWGTEKKTGVSIESLKQAGAIEEKHKPATLLQRAFPYLVMGTPVLLLLLGGLWLWHWMTQLNEKKLYREAMEYATSAKSGQVGAEGQAALFAYAGEYQVRAGDGKLAHEEFGKALARARASRNPESDALLLDLLRLQGTLYDLPADTDRDKAARAADVQKQLSATLKGLSDPDARQEGLRRAVAILLEHKDGARAVPLALQVYPPGDADHGEALATVALELLRAGKDDLAGPAVEVALEPYKEKDPKKRPELRRAVVAAAVALGRTPPVPGKGLADLDADRLGRPLGLAYKGQPEEGRKVLYGARDPDALRALADLAAATGDPADVNAASDALAQARDVNPAAQAWTALRVVELAQRAKLGGERVKAATAAVPGTLNAWAQLLAFRERLAAARSVENPSVIEETFPMQSLAANVARLELAWHNTKRERGWGSKVRSWDEGPKAFGSLGVALGMQGK